MRGRSTRCAAACCAGWCSTRRRSPRTFGLSLSDAGEMVFLPRLLKRLRRDAPGIDVAFGAIAAGGTGTRDGRRRGGAGRGYFPDLKKDAYYQQRLFAQAFVCIMDARRRLEGDRLTLKEFMAASHAVVRPQGAARGIRAQARGKALKRRVALSIHTS